MSELILFGTRKITVNGRDFIDEAWFYDYLYQTPSNLTEEVLNIEGFDNQIEKYLAWVKEHCSESTYESHRKSLAVKIAFDEAVGWKFSFSCI